MYVYKMGMVERKPLENFCNYLYDGNATSIIDNLIEKNMLDEKKEEGKHKLIIPRKKDPIVRKHYEKDIFGKMRFTGELVKLFNDLNK